MKGTRKKHSDNSLHARFCRCIKAVTKQTKPGSIRRNKKESRAIAICVKSVIQKTKKKTLHSFRCTGKKQFLKTQLGRQ